MAQITLRGVGHSYASTGHEEAWALNPLDLVWDDGRTYALLGPSGCGKTTMLNIISGLVRPTRGRVLFDERDVTDMPTAKRNIAQVFQFPVIYGAMSVYENLAFPLVCRKWPRERIARKVAEIADVLDLGRELRRPARALTAAEKQLISLARGLVREDVTALLMDEPLTFADEVVVMNEGRVIQRGSPEELFEYPRTTYVGYFIGSPAMNLFPASADGTALVFGGSRLGSGYEVAALPPGKVEVGVRPEYLELVSEPGENTLPATVTGTMDQGGVRVVALSVAGQ